MTDTKLAAAMLKRAYEVVHHDIDCPAIGGNGDDDCKCDAVPFLRDLKAALALEQPAVDVSDAMVERAAEGIWNACSHKMLEKAGYVTDWAGQPNTIKRDYHKQARAALAQPGMVVVPRELVITRKTLLKWYGLTDDYFFTHEDNKIEQLAHRLREIGINATTERAMIAAAQGEG